MAERAYIRDGAEIYRRSFAIIRAEAELGRFDALEERVAVRIIHACGMTEIARDIVLSPGFAEPVQSSQLTLIAFGRDAPSASQRRTSFPCSTDEPPNVAPSARSGTGSRSTRRFWMARRSAFRCSRAT